jgi:hypothetical protein
MFYGKKTSNHIDGCIQIPTGGRERTVSLLISGLLSQRINLFTVCGPTGPATFDEWRCQILHEEIRNFQK